MQDDPIYVAVCSRRYTVRATRSGKRRRIAPSETRLEDRVIKCRCTSVLPSGACRTNDPTLTMNLGNLPREK
ncbi:unnamed protein product [Colias eurytheme]|nr:unnamed protein product [Colias eurytheme]